MRANESSLILGAFNKPPFPFAPPCPFGSPYCETVQNVGRIYALQAQWLLYVPPGLPPRNSKFCPYSLFMCFVWIWEQAKSMAVVSTRSTELKTKDII